MRHRVGLAIVCLHISSGLYLLLAVMMFPILVAEDGRGLTLAIIMSAFCVALSIGVEIVAVGLGRRKLWAWVAGLCVFGTYVPSLFFPLGALGLWGLLDAGSRAQFGIGRKQGAAGPRVAPGGRPHK
jgi:hypothetical protein